MSNVTGMMDIKKAMEEAFQDSCLVRYGGVKGYTVERLADRISCPVDKLGPALTELVKEGIVAIDTGTKYRPYIVFTPTLS